MAFDLLDQVEANLNTAKVSISEFAQSPEFCNKRLYPRQLLLLKLFFLEDLTEREEEILDYWIAGGRGGDEIKISPNIRERIKYLKDHGYEHFSEINLVGGRRSSKGFMTGVAMAKIMYDTLQLQDPGRHFGIDPEKDIYFSCVAGSEAQAKEYQFADFVSTVESCKAFEPYIQKTLELEFRVATNADLRKIQQAKTRGGKMQRDIAKLRGKALAANASTLRGSATMAICIDEMAHMIAGETKSSADQVYNAAKPSLDQFGKAAMTFCNSSPYSKVGMFYERYQEAMKPFDPNKPIGSEDNGSPFLLSFQYPSWALFEGYQESEHNFGKAITVSADWDENELNEDGTYFWSEEDRINIVKARTEESSNPETYKVERRGKFAEVTDAYLNPRMVDRIFEGVPTGEFESNGNPVLAPIPINEGHTASNLFKYAAHLDPSSTTAGFGFALGHAEVFEDAQGRRQQHVVFDIVKRWNPDDFPGKTIQWEVVIQEVLLYCDLFRPFEVSLDQFQSHEPIQRLRQLLADRNIGSVIVTEEFATSEKNWNRAETFKTAINHGLVHAPSKDAHPDIELVSQELKFLQQKNSQGKFPKVDKQDIGPVRTKDMADCMMEVTQSLIGNIMAQDMRDRLMNTVMVPGSPGGYQIGGAQGRVNSLKDANPALYASLYGVARQGEQSAPGPGYYNTRPSRAAVGGMGRRGISRGFRRR